jgi:hypothetical protein
MRRPPVWCAVVLALAGCVDENEERIAVDDDAAAEADVGNADGATPRPDGAAPGTDGAAPHADGALAPGDGAVAPGDGAVNPSDGAVADGAAAPADATGEDPDAAPPAPDADVPEELPRFSFFVTSLEAMRALSGSENGFGGDLGGLEGADSICRRTAALSGLPGAERKTWRAFLSTATGGADGGPIHAIDRVGEGPWYDRNGLLVAEDRAGLTSGDRPAGDPRIVSDLPNERGEPQRQFGDNHDILTATNERGQFAGGGRAATCNDWTSAVGATGRPLLGHSWPARSGRNWMRAHPAHGCAAGVNLVQDGPGRGDSVGAGGGYGGIYCFALEP